MDSSKFTASDNYLGGTHIDGEQALTIKDVYAEELRDGNVKLCVAWREDFLPWLLNKTNTRRLQNMFGSADTDKWVGQEITIWFDPEVEYMGDVTGGLRVRVPPKKK